ncbi:ABC transporter permease [Sulfuricurvum sp.]|uniref:ABC transporter permease n=1 Tax=Sulfuricurvum sp. TaxID=2025608 RepID=UPI002E3784DC|nr:ABC transporter permease [Sulfuricurvum sp.]HEX5329654.1 ABC transporter permease [Sulfuricurvum sp.]
MQSVLPASLQLITDTDQTRIICSGSWTIQYLNNVTHQLEMIQLQSNVLWDMEAISDVDSAGVALYHLMNRKFEQQGFVSTTITNHAYHSHLYRLLYEKPFQEALPPPTPSWLYKLGHQAHLNLLGISAFLAFLGEAFVLLLFTLRHPHLIRYRSIGAHILETGARALPIIAISAFLIGVVIAYQSIVQLQKFGADIFIVDTIGISLTRELAPLITAIVVAGRSGSAFTAQIGAMKMTQEIDAMKTMGFDPFTFLVWPRVIALMIVMPLLIFFADMVGIFGGMVIAATQSHLSFTEFIHRLQGALALKHYLIGILKGPFFAFLIAFVSTYRGFQVSMNTESIGQYTTKSVVNAIFLVIACDAIFSVLLTELKL